MGGRAAAAPLLVVVLAGGSLLSLPASEEPVSTRSWLSPTDSSIQISLDAQAACCFKL